MPDEASPENPSLATVLVADDNEVAQRLCRRVLETAATDVVGIGVGCGGPMIYPDGLVSPLNIVSPSGVPIWRDFPLRARLAEAFGRPCVVDNDAKALALGERWQGAGRGSNNMLGMVVSTGVGGGIILDGQYYIIHRALPPKYSSYTPMRKTDAVQN